MRHRSQQIRSHAVFNSFIDISIAFARADLFLSLSLQKIVSWRILIENIYNFFSIWFVSLTLIQNARLIHIARLFDTYALYETSFKKFIIFSLYLTLRVLLHNSCSNLLLSVHVRNWENSLVSFGTNEILGTPYCDNSVGTLLIRY